MCVADHVVIAGEFSVDLYTLPDDLLKKMWEFMVSL